jgi:cullin 1
LIQACERALILDHLDFIRGEFIILLQCDDRENLGRMYRLLSRMPGGLDPLRTQFESHLRETGLKEAEYALEVKDILEPSGYVATLYPIITKYERMVSEVFNQEAEFMMSFNKACQRIVNRNKACKNNPTKSSELLALYTNTLLMHSTPVAIQEGELQVSIHKIVSDIPTLSTPSNMARSPCSHT